MRFAPIAGHSSIPHLQNLIVERMPVLPGNIFFGHSQHYPTDKGLLNMRQIGFPDVGLLSLHDAFVTGKIVNILAFFGNLSGYRSQYAFGVRISSYHII